MDGNGGTRTVARFRPYLWAALAAPLVAAAVAMRFTAEVNWSAGDFLAAALILLAVGGGVELAGRLARRPALRIALAAAAVMAGALVWAEAAVGLLR